jgi:hypothetical protein
MTLICRTSHSSEHYDGCDFAVIEVTADLLVRIAALLAAAQGLKDTVGGFYTLSVWDCTPDYLDDIPEAWEEWIDDLDYGEWAELPFPYDRTTAKDELDGLTVSLGRTECDQLRATTTDVFWFGILKHSSSTVETPHFPQLGPLVQLASLHPTTPDI